MWKIKFKVGDKVRCIDASGQAEESLVEGEIYTVKDSYDCGGNVVDLEEVREVGWYASRFELIMSETTVIDTLKSLTQSDKVFISFEKGKMIVVDAKYQVDYTVNSLEEAEKVVALIEKSATYEDEITEIDRKLEEFKGE